MQNEREWAALCTLGVSLPALLDDPRFDCVANRVTHRAALHALLAPTLAAEPRDAIMAQLTRVGVACGALNTVADLLVHPQLRLDTAATPDGTRYVLPALGYALSGGLGGDSEGDNGILRCPALGEHNTAILTELGMQQ